ncbi:hypothetical protein BGX28_009704 [Mortierella sp. GBA30]|nr:hypothetical protein BGX28_009704 [Mortierella sp. GBA30]
MSSSHSHTSDTNEALVPAATSVEEERIPMPPPREFRRKSAATTPPPSTLHSAVSNGVFSVGSSIFKPGSPNGRTQSTNSSSSSLNRISGIPALGTVRANSAKFNNLIAAGAVDTPNPKAFAPKIKNTVTSSTNATANGTPTANPWTSRKVVDVLRRNSLSKGTGMMARKSTDVRSDLPATDWKSIPAPLEVDVDKELPPIRSITPHSHLTTEFNAPGTLGKVRDDVEHESKCIVSDEERIRSPSTLPVAADTSKEILVEPEGKSLTVAETQVTPPPREPARDNEAGLRSGHQSGFVCSSCDEPISGMMITAMGKRWHSDHFVCTVCNLNLEHVQFFQKDGLPYCHLDYHEKFSPKCGHCNTAIENECLTALGKSWHPGHFFCRECGDPFEEDGYMVHDDQPYCEKDYLRLFAPKCTGCQDPIQGDFINALKGKWHRDCFGCTVCHIGFDTSSYYVENGKPYCQVHYKNGAKSTST